MTRLIIQIPCLNEAQTLPALIGGMPDHIAGVDSIELLVIDDGSSDDTARIARLLGVHHVVQHRRNRGLASAFQTGLDTALAAGADIIVNTDGDGQYSCDDIERLIVPILQEQADIVIGDRGVGENVNFGYPKRCLQLLGSALVRKLSRTDVRDAVSGFRAMSRTAAQNITITTEFSYTTDMLIQAGRKRMKIVSIPIRTGATRRPSRLFRSIPEFIARQLMTVARVYATYNPLRTFALIGGTLTMLGLIPIFRFLFHYASGNGSGRVQSLVLGGALVIIGILCGLMGILADLISANRKLLETTLYRIRRLEDRHTPPASLPNDAPEEAAEKRRN